jgi:hypothetical protein
MMTSHGYVRRGYPMTPVDVNVSIAEDASQIYEGVQVSRMSMRITRSRVIHPRYEIDEVESLIGQFFDDFPLDRPLIEQSAYWLRFFAGFHFFQDANHRTGMNTLEVAMMDSGLNSPAFMGKEYRGRTRAAREKSKHVRNVGGCPWRIFSRKIAFSRFGTDTLRMYYLSSRTLQG